MVFPSSSLAPHPGAAGLLPGLFAHAGRAEAVLFRAYVFGNLRRRHSFRRGRAVDGPVRRRPPAAMRWLPGQVKIEARPIPPSRLQDGSVLEQEGGFWIKIQARQVPPSELVRHGIRYSLTLHDRFGTRVLGYDNAHAVKPPKKLKFAGRRLTCDHWHPTASGKGAPYAFESAQRLLEDFFTEVDRVIKEAQQ